jgi:hypothetical protein
MRSFGVSRVGGRLEWVAKTLKVAFRMLAKRLHYRATRCPNINISNSLLMVKINGYRFNHLPY